MLVMIKNYFLNFIMFKRSVITSILVVLVIMLGSSAIASGEPHSSITCPDGTIVTAEQSNPCSSHQSTASLHTGDSQKIYDRLTQLINFLSAIVGIVVVGSIILAGIQYSSASADPQKISAAKDRIRNAVIALVAYLFIFAFLTYLVPGGLF